MKLSEAIEQIEYGVASGYRKALYDSYNYCVLASPASLLKWAYVVGDHEVRNFLRGFAGDFYERDWPTSLSYVNDKLAGSKEQVLLFLDAAWELAVQLEEVGETIYGYDGYAR